MDGKFINTHNKTFSSTMIAYLAIIVLSFCSSTLYALGMGNIQVNSALNETFSAQIPLRDLGRNSLDDVRASIATLDKFDEVGLDRPGYLSYLQFAVKSDSNDQPIIYLTSTKPIVEPIMTFLLEVRSSHGIMYREYTVFLDPPIYDKSSSQVITTSAQATIQQPRQIKSTTTVQSFTPKTTIKPAAQQTAIVPKRSARTRQTPVSTSVLHEQVTTTASQTEHMVQAKTPRNVADHIKQPTVTIDETEQSPSDLDDDLQSLPILEADPDSGVIVADERDETLVLDDEGSGKFVAMNNIEEIDDDEQATSIFAQQEDLLPVDDADLMKPSSDIHEKSLAKMSTVPQAHTTMRQKPSVAKAAEEIYGPTVKTDHLWTIAARLKPNDSVNVEQTLVAIFRHNPQAFRHQNINGLRSGQRLKIPTVADIAKISPHEASQVIQSQNQAWQQLRSHKQTSKTHAKPSTHSSPPAKVASSSPAAMASQQPSSTAMTADPVVNRSQSKKIAAGQPLDQVDDSIAEQIAPHKVPASAKPIAEKPEKITIKTAPLGIEGQGLQPSATGKGQINATESLRAELAVVVENLQNIEQSNALLTSEITSLESKNTDLQKQIAEKEQAIQQLKQVTTQQTTVTTSNDGAVTTMTNMVKSQGGEIALDNRSVGWLMPVILIVFVLLLAVVFYLRLWEKITFLRKRESIETQDLQVPQETNNIEQSPSASGADVGIMSKVKTAFKTHDLDTDPVVKKLDEDDIEKLDLDDMLALASEHMASKRFQQAETSLVMSLEQNSDRYDIRLRLCELYCLTGDYDEFVGCKRKFPEDLERRFPEIWKKLQQITPDKWQQNPQRIDSARQSIGSGDPISADRELTTSEESSLQPLPDPVSETFETPGDEVAALDSQITDITDGEDLQSDISISSAALREGQENTIEFQTGLGEGLAPTIRQDKIIEPTTEKPKFTQTKQSGMDDVPEIATKLDLARTYLSMEEYDAAKKILFEVEDNASPRQRADANNLIREIDKAIKNRPDSDN